MSIIAGIYKRKAGVDAEGRIFAELKTLVSRRENDALLEFENESVSLVKLNIGAFNDSGFVQNIENSALILAGEILFSNFERDSRNSESETLLKAVSTNDFEKLKTVRGAFCAAVMTNDKLYLISDKLGLRPLYFWFDDEKFIFASALRILENLSVIPKTIDLQGIMEISALGYPLADRTAYENIFTISAAEIITVDAKKVQKQTFFPWDEIEISDESEEILLKRLYEDFQTATTRRLGDDKTTVAYLSGGLDSRCVVSALKTSSAEIHTFNFARPNTQDLIFGRQFAEAVQVWHNEIPKASGEQVPDYSSKMAKALEGSTKFAEKLPERPQIVWSGEGGSVALGHVHVGRRIVDFMRQGKLKDAVSEYIGRESLYLNQKFLNANLSSEIFSKIFESISAEIQKYNATDAGRNFFLYLMLNDQRRKLAKHFENIDLHRLEFQLPFFDSRFLETILTVPLDLCLEHKFYVKWLYLFPKKVTNVAWQAYPGHEPCPIQVHEKFSYQWDENYQSGEQQALSRKHLADTLQMLRSEAFPVKILNKNKLRAAVLLHRIGLRDYTHIFETAQVYYNFSERCSPRKS